MSSSHLYPAVRPRPEAEVKVQLEGTGPYGTPDLMTHGFQNAKNQLSVKHPLEFSEDHWVENQHKMDLMMLRNTQGIHAPIRLTNERKMAQQIQRLPCLPSSHLMLDTLTGRDEMITFEDILNNPVDSEVMGQPHVLVEKRLGLL